MRYDKRVQIIKTVTSEGYLGSTESDSEPVQVPCSISGLTDLQKQTYFSPDYRGEAYQVHLLGNPAKYAGIKYVTYRGIKHEVVNVRILRNRMVVVIS